MSRFVSSLDLMNRARDASDMENSTFVLDPELLGLVNSFVPELHDLLITNYGEDYFHKTTTPKALTVNLAGYQLPDDFYKLYGVDVESNTNSNLWIPLRRFGERERTLGESGLPSTVDWLKYRLRGNTVVFAPPPRTATRYRVQYVPIAPTLINTIIKKADVAFASDQITLTDHRMTGDHPLRFTVTAGRILPAGLVASTTYYAIIVDANTFQVSTTVGGSALDITDDGTGEYGLLSMFDGVNGWEELIVLSTAIRMLAKEESDVKPLQVERERLQERLNTITDNRDQGEPEKIQDVLGDLPGQEFDRRWPPTL